MRELCTTEQHRKLERTIVFVPWRPRLAVCRGLVYHALVDLEIFAKRRARASFGIACRVRRGKSLQNRWAEIKKDAKAKKRPVVIDQFKQKWFENCIDWFLLKV
ncbi:hypothetical protein ACJ41O_003198 [Fusarium nematophilum]